MIVRIMRAVRRIRLWWARYMDEVVRNELDRESEFPPSAKGITWAIEPLKGVQNSAQD